MLSFLKRPLVRLAAAQAFLGPIRRCVATGGVTVFMYHEIGADEDEDDAWQIVRRSDFTTQVLHLQAHYDIVDLDTAQAALRAESMPSRPLAVLTFDDGLRGNYEHLLPLLEQLRVPATIYVATGHIESQQGYWFDRIANALQPGFDGHIDLAAFGMGTFELSGPPGARRWSQVQRVLAAAKTLDDARCSAVADAVSAQVFALVPEPAPSVLVPMTVNMLEELAAHPLITLGVHTHGHELLPLLAPEAARRTVQASLVKLQEWTGQQARHFAYPAGRCDVASRAVIAGLGFATAVGTMPGVWTAASDALHIPRMSVGRYDDLSTFKLNTVGGLGQALGCSGRAAARTASAS